MHSNVMYFVTLNKGLTGTGCDRCIKAQLGFSLCVSNSVCVCVCVCVCV